MIIDKEFNIRFSGSYELLKWVLQKYKSELPYNGEIFRFAVSNRYSENTCNHWSYRGVNERVWNMIHKDLVIANLMGAVKDEDVRDLDCLKKEFEALSL